MAIASLSINGKRNISSQIIAVVNQIKVDAICVATAYLTLDGAKFLEKLADEKSVKSRVIVIGVSGDITHPAAITFLRDNDWAIRLGQSTQGIFHPKLLVAGIGYSKNSGIKKPLACYLGSGNFTAAGLYRNTELGCTSTEVMLTESTATAFFEAWKNSKDLTTDALSEYGKRFSQRLKERTVRELQHLEIVDVEAVPRSRARIQRSQSVLGIDSCSTVWVGLESFTGEHTFQVEVPGFAGRVLDNLLNSRGGAVTIDCSDGTSRNMLFRYYDANGMFRLNVPNDVPLVSQARLAKGTGKKYALTITVDEYTGHLAAEILFGKRLLEFERKSAALGTLGTTSTRKYGWF